MAAWLLAAGAPGLTLPAAAAPPPAVASVAPSAAFAPDLDTLVAWQRRSCPGVHVTSGFQDWRGVSFYRARPGLHGGYDLAMPAGTPVLAGWFGRVEAVTPWGGGEVGVTVRGFGGWEVCYGHLRASVRPGQLVRPGEVVGTVALDHLDVKVRDPLGRLFDFGAPSRAKVPLPESAGEALKWLEAYFDCLELEGRIAAEVGLEGELALGSAGAGGRAPSAGGGAPAEGRRRRSLGRSARSGRGLAAALPQPAEIQAVRLRFEAAREEALEAGVTYRQIEELLGCPLASPGEVDPLRARLVRELELTRQRCARWRAAEGSGSRQARQLEEAQRRRIVLEEALTLLRMLPTL